MLKLKKSKEYAVITGDVIDSSSYSTVQRELINNTMQEIVTSLSSSTSDWVQYRGDSIQGILSSPQQALRYLLLLKSKMKSIVFDDKQRGAIVDMRIAIGIGTIEIIGKDIASSDGKAFQLSGRALDEMKGKNHTITFSKAWEEENSPWNVIMSLLDQIVHDWSSASAEVVHLLLKGKSDAEISEWLDVSRSAVSQRKKYAGWDAIEKTLLYFEDQFNTEE